MGVQLREPLHSIFKIYQETTKVVITIR
jgi:hypothetical protein